MSYARISEPAKVGETFTIPLPLKAMQALLDMSSIPNKHDVPFIVHVEGVDARQIPIFKSYDSTNNSNSESVK